MSPLCHLNPVGKDSLVVQRAEPSCSYNNGHSGPPSGKNAHPHGIPHHQDKLTLVGGQCLRVGKTGGGDFTGVRSPPPNGEKMTRKHFEAIARTIRTLDLDAAEMRIVAIAMARTLATFNPAFNRGRFLKACGVGE